MNILVTGGCGYIGSVLCLDLKNKGYNVVSLDTDYFNNEKYLINNKIKNIKKDIRDINKEDLKGIDRVIHLAYLSNDPCCEYDPDVVWDINLLGSLNIAKISKDNGIRHFLFASSASIYGSSDGIVDENCKNLNPISRYGLNKKITEEELMMMNDDDFKVTCFRQGTVYGLSSRMRFDLMVNTMVLSAFNKGVIIINDAFAKRPSICVKDVSRAYCELISNDPIPGIFNLGGYNLNVAKVGKKIKNKIKDLNMEVELNILNNKESKDKRSYFIDSTKFCDLFDFNFKYDIEDSVEEILNFLKNYNNPFDPKAINSITKDALFSLLNKKLNRSLRWMD